MADLMEIHILQGYLLISYWGQMKKKKNYVQERQTLLLNIFL